MAATTSRWRLQARQVIAETLAKLPETATQWERKRAVQDAYPFGLREMHPYRIWLQEVRDTFREGNEKPPLIPKWYKVVIDEERCFLDAIRKSELDRSTLLFDATDILVFADFLEERNDRRGEAWRQLGGNVVWPMRRTPKTWRWQPWLGHSLRASWELDSAVFDRMRNIVHLSHHSGSHVERFADYRNVFHALCDYAQAFGEKTHG